MMRHSTVHPSIVNRIGGRNSSSRGSSSGSGSISLGLNPGDCVSHWFGTVFDMDFDGWQGGRRCRSNTVGGGILNLDALFLFITLARGFGALPAAKRGDFGLCQTEFIENSKKSAMPGESPQSHAMGAIGIVQTGILGFNAIQRTVESRGFNADFRNEIASNMSRERGWITGTRTRKSGIVDQLGKGWHMHGDDSRGEKKERPARTTEEDDRGERRRKEREREREEREKRKDETI